MIENKNSLTNLQVNAKCKVCNHWEKKMLLLQQNAQIGKKNVKKKKTKTKLA